MRFLPTTRLMRQGGCAGSRCSRPLLTRADIGYQGDSIMKTVLYFFIGVTLFVVSSIARGNSLDKFCHNIGDKGEQLCDVSISLLASNGEYFDGKRVMVRGYLAAMRPPKTFEQSEGYISSPLLFSSKEAFSTSNVPDSVAIKLPHDERLRKRLTQLNHSLVNISGRYQSKAIDTARVSGFGTAGQIVDVDSAGDGYGPWDESLPPPSGLLAPPHKTRASE